MQTPILIEDLGTHPISENSIHKKRFGIFLCRCGSKFKTSVGSVKSGRTNSCGCYKRQRVSETHKKHGKYNHILYIKWIHIKARCYNKNDAGYINYGGRGITMCNEWLSDFMNFYNWATNNGWDKKLEIDRINNDGNYEPNNCRFVNNTIQNRNTRKICKSNKSGYRGVSIKKDTNIYVTQISIDYKKKHLGYFDTALEAAHAYDNYVKENNLEHTTNF